MNRTHAVRRSIAVVIMLLVVAVGILQNPDVYQAEPPDVPPASPSTLDAATALNTLEVKGRAPKTGYARSQFGNGWSSIQGCDTRNEVLRRDLVNTIINTKCQVVSGVLYDPYTGKTIAFERGSATSQAVQIDHVVALSDAWQKGAQQLSASERVQLANDPLELLAVDGPANQQKGDGDAATWLPSNKAFRCQYVARQVAVKKKYRLWVTPAEKDAIVRVLKACPAQPLPGALGVDSQEGS